MFSIRSFLHCIWTFWFVSALSPCKVNTAKFSLPSCLLFNSSNYRSASSQPCCSLRCLPESLPSFYSPFPGVSHTHCNYQSSQMTRNWKDSLQAAILPFNNELCYLPCKEVMMWDVHYNGSPCVSDRICSTLTCKMWDWSKARVNTAGLECPLKVHIPLWL